MRCIDLIGKRFGKLVVLKRTQSDKHGHSRWICLCDCGNIKETSGDNLLRGFCNSCGCIQKEVNIKRSTKHNLCYTRVYNIWCGIKTRCLNKNDPGYKNYGGRGISICKEWLDKGKGFKNFYDWAMANGYADDLTIDRIDVNGDYCPENCRWATNKEQQNNKRNNHIVCYNGNEKTLAEWTIELGFHDGILYQRINTSGWTVEKAFNTPIKKQKNNHKMEGLK